MASLVFLKLGGSLITEKSKPMTPRRDVLSRLSEEIAAARQAQPDLQLVLGHGSGSFGHVAGHKYGTRQGVRTSDQWLGFAEVWQAARALNEIVVESLAGAGIPVVAFPPSAWMIAQNGKPETTEIEPIQKALDHHLVPLVNGDVAFDRSIGGTIVSTEDVFFYLARQLKPNRILISSIEEGVWADFPQRTQLLKQITTSSLPEIENQLAGSTVTDVTGGMAQKVKVMVSLAEEIPGLEILIFSGMEPGNVQNTLSGQILGTVIRAND